MESKASSFLTIVGGHCGYDTKDIDHCQSDGCLAVIKIFQISSLPE